jgi:hypothetical protein
VDPASGVERNLFAAEGVTYTVVAEDGATKTYTVKATIAAGELSSECDIIEFNINGGDPWEILGNVISKIYLSTDAEANDHGLYPVITVSPGASVSPESYDPQDFYTAEGVTYTVTAADGTQKIYNAIAWVEQVGPTGVLADKTGWTAESRNGHHAWNDIGACGPYPEDCDGLTAGGEAFRVLDNNVWTGWHSNPAADIMPQCIVIDMQASKRVSSFVLHHRPDALPSADHEKSWIYFNTIQVYISDTPYNPNEDDPGWSYYETLINEYVWDGETIPATFTLPVPVEGRYMMLLFTDSREATYISFSELDVYLDE